MRSNNSGQVFFGYLLVYLLLLFHAGFFFTGQLTRYTNIGLLFISLFYIIVYGKRFDEKMVLVVMITFLLQMITFGFTGLSDVNRHISIVVDLLTCLLIVTCMDYHRFKKYFANINIVICIVSLLFFVFFLFKLPVFSHLPQLTNLAGQRAYFAGLSMPRVDPGWSYRIQGIYWEPGAFQFFIVLSVLFDMFDNEMSERTRLCRFIIFMITLFLSYSTTGMLCGVILMILYIIKFGRFKILAFTILGVVAAAVFYYGVIREDTYLYYAVFGKMDRLEEAYMYGSSGEGSADKRLDAFTYSLQAFRESPIVGIGAEGRDKINQAMGHSIFTFTPLNYFAYYGFLLGLIHVIGFIKAMDYKRKRKFELFFVAITVVLSTTTENFTFNPILMCFTLYGYALTNSNNQISQMKSIYNP